MEDADQIIEHVGRRIAELRAAAGLTQADVAERIETAVSNYQRIEHGLQNVTIRTLVKISGALGVPVIRLFERPSGPRSGRGRPSKRQ